MGSADQEKKEPSTSELAISISKTGVTLNLSSIPDLLRSFFAGAQEKRLTRAAFYRRSTEHILAKLEGDEQLSETDLALLRHTLGRRVADDLRVAQIIEAAVEAQPIVARQMAALPPPSFESSAAGPANSGPSDDWINRFVADAQNISNRDMQALYARILAGESIRPGTFSMRTLMVLRMLDQATAQLFSRLQKYIFMKNVPHLFSVYDKMLKRDKLTYNALKRLEETGLIHIDENTMFSPPCLHKDPPTFFFQYYDRMIRVRTPGSSERVSLHVLMLTDSAEELLTVIEPPPENEQREVLELVPQWIGEAPNKRIVDWALLSSPNADLRSISYHGFDAFRSVKPSSGPDSAKT